MQQFNGIQLPRLHSTRQLPPVILFVFALWIARFDTRQFSLACVSSNIQRETALRTAVTTGFKVVPLELAECSQRDTSDVSSPCIAQRLNATRNNSRLTDSTAKSHIHTRAPIYRRRTRDWRIIQITRKIRKAIQRRLPENFDADLAAGSSLGRRCEHRATGTPTKALKRSTTTTAVTETTADVDRSRRRGGGFGAPRQILSSH